MDRVRRSTTLPGPPRGALYVLLAGSLIAGLAGLASLAGCASSPPARFYSLTAVPSETPAQPASSWPVAVRVAAVHIPPVLDREEIVRRGPANALEISGLDRWGTPLDEMVQQVLTEDLLERLPSGRVVLPSSPAPAGTDEIVVDLLQFQSDETGTIVLQGSWSLLEPASSVPSQVREVRDSETAQPSDYGNQAAVMSGMLGRLADDIARGVARP